MLRVNATVTISGGAEGRGTLEISLFPLLSIPDEADNAKGLALIGAVTQLASLPWLMGVGGVLFATPAFSAACERERPDWQGDPVDWVDNLIHFLFTPLGTFFVLAAAAVTILKHDALRWAAFALAAASGTLSLWQVLAPDPVRLAAIAEGCIGGGAETIVCVLLLLGLSLRTTIRGPA